MSEDATPLLDDASQLNGFDGRRVRLLGIYLPLPTLKKMPRPGHPRQEADLGEVAIQLRGEACAYDPSASPGTPARIALGRAFRPREEIARLGHRRVLVEGRLALSAGGAFVPGIAAPRPGAVLEELGEPWLAE